ncbi:MAG TPA: hypothetical protein VFH51_10470, partial [Myxococcota bacterium]|nr:hypothetical protein [Myxococcota bacterium]
PMLAAFLRREPLPTTPPTRTTLYPLNALFAQSCQDGDLATAVQVLALPWAGRPFHHWLLELELLSGHLELTDRIAQHPLAATLPTAYRAFLAAAQADRLIYYLPPLPVPGEPETGQVLVIGADAGEPAPPPDVVAPAPDLTAAIGGYRLAYRLYRDADYPHHALACLHRLIDLSLYTREEARLREAAGWAKDGLTRSDELQLPAESASFLYQLALIQTSVDQDLAAHLSLLHLLRLPRAAIASPLLERAWRFLGYLYELHGDPLDALVCYLQTLPPSDQPPPAETLPSYVSGALAAFDLHAGQAVVDQAFGRLRDPTWTPPLFPATALPPFADPPGDLDDPLPEA